jgi:hypothetical protein
MPDLFSYKLYPDAEQEYLDAYLWYEEQQEGLGEKFAISVRKKLQLIYTNPDFYSKKKGRYHEAPLYKPFPFVIVYFVDKKENLVVVTSIFYTSRNPKLKYKSNFEIPITPSLSSAYW